jgi:Tfp pilus assembly protein PilF
MASSFHQYLLAFAAAAVVGSPVLAQSSLQEAVTQLRLGEKDAALEKLKQILAEDPSNEQALELYNSVSQNEWYLLVTSQG